MNVQIGKPAPAFEVEAWMRGANGPQKVSLADHKGRWVVLFFYPRDFTFICPTEIEAFAKLADTFRQEEADLIGASTDSFYTHKAWFESDPRLAGVTFPVLADTAHSVARAYGVLLDDGAALRGTYVIDPTGVVRHISLNELDVGRNVDELLRIVRALKTGELCPVGWQPGMDTLSAFDKWLAKALPRLSKAVLVEMAKTAKTETYWPGDAVFEEGDAPDRFYVVSEGQANVVRQLSNGEQFVLTTLEPGDYFGEIGLLTEARRTASVRAKSKLEVMALGWEDFMKLVETSEGTHADFAAIMRQRLERG